MIMQPATMLSRAEPTRSPWYSPTLTGFIQQVEALHLVLTVTGNFTVICRSLAASFSFTLSDTETLSLAEPPSQFSIVQDASCIFKDEDQVSIATENEKAWGTDSNDSDTHATNLIIALFRPLVSHVL